MVRKKIRNLYTFNSYNPGIRCGHLHEELRELSQEQDNWTFQKLLDGYDYQCPMQPPTAETMQDKELWRSSLRPVSTTPEGCVIYFDGCNLEWTATPRGIGLTEEDNILIIPRFFLTEDPSEELIKAINNTKRRGDYVKFGLNPVLLDPCEIMPKFLMGHDNHTSPEAAASCRNVLKNIHEVLFEAIERHIKLLFENRAPPLVPDFSRIKSRLASNEYLHSEDCMKDIYQTVVRYQHASRIVKEIRHRRSEGEQRLVVVTAVFQLLGYFVAKLESGDEYVTMESIIPDQVVEYLAADNSDGFDAIHLNVDATVKSRQTMKELYPDIPNFDANIDECLRTGKMVVANPGTNSINSGNNDAASGHSEYMQNISKQMRDQFISSCMHGEPVKTATVNVKSADETQSVMQTSRSMERVILVGPPRDFTGFTTDVYQCPTVIMKGGNEHTNIQDIIDTYNLNTGLKIEEILDFDSTTLGEFCNENHDHNPSCLDIFYQFQDNVQHKHMYHLAVKRKEVDERSVDELVASIESTEITTKKKKAKKKKKEKKEDSNDPAISTAKDDANHIDSESIVENESQAENLAPNTDTNSTQNISESAVINETLTPNNASHFQHPNSTATSNEEDETQIEANLDQEDGFHEVKRKNQNDRKDTKKKRSSMDKAGSKDNKAKEKRKSKGDSPKVTSIKKDSKIAPLNRIDTNPTQKQISTKENEENHGGAKRKTVKKKQTESEPSKSIIQTKYSGLSLDEIDVVTVRNCKELEGLNKRVKDLDESAQEFMVDMQDKLGTVQTRIDKMEDKTHANDKQVAAIDDELNELAKKIKKLKSDKKRIDSENIELKRDIEQLTEERKSLEKICEKDILDRKNIKESHLEAISKLEENIKLLKEERSNKESSNGKMNGFSEEIPKVFQNGHDEKNNSSQPQNNDKLLEFLKSQIAAKESDLECPVCMEVSQPPIYMCQEQHIICSLCWNKVKMRSGSKLPECVQCRSPYPDPPRHHRYMEKVAEELNQLYIMSAINKES